MSSSTYASVGDIINVSVLAASLLYAVGVVYLTQPGIEGILDEEWKRHGFCIKDMDVPYFSSFDTCLYVDVIFSLILGIMYLSWRNLPGMASSSEIMPMVIVSTLGHGMAHGGMSAKFRDGTYEAALSGDVEEEIPAWWQIVLFCAVFWFPLLKAAMPKVSSQYVFGVALAVTYGPLLLAGGLKKELRFGYVQTIVSIAFHTSQLMLSPDEKNHREYMTLPIASILPVVTAWNEALFCTAYFRSLGGHVLYDASIIISSIVYYADCYRVNVMSSSSRSTGKVVVSSKEKTM